MTEPTIKSRDTSSVKLTEGPYNLQGYATQGGDYADVYDGGKPWNYSTDHLAAVLRASLKDLPVSADDFHAALHRIERVRENERDIQSRGGASKDSKLPAQNHVAGRELIPVLTIAAEGIRRSTETVATDRLAAWVEILRETVSRCMRDQSVGSAGTEKTLPADTVDSLSAGIALKAVFQHRPPLTLNFPAEAILEKTKNSLLNSAWWLQAVGAMIREVEFAPATRSDRSPFARVSIGGLRMPPIGAEREGHPKS